MDVKTAFLHAPLESDLYVEPPSGYGDSDPNIVWQLNKSIYGLKQSGHNWNKMLHSVLTDFGCTQSKQIIVYISNMLVTRFCVY